MNSCKTRHLSKGGLYWRAAYIRRNTVYISVCVCVCVRECVRVCIYQTCWQVNKLKSKSSQSH